MQVAIIIEWENTLLSEAKRSIEMLRTLNRQISELHHSEREGILRDISFPINLVISFDPKECPTPDVRKIVDPYVSTNKDIHINYLPVEGKTYYALKNYAAKKTESDIVIFLDSDVVPHLDWLEQLLRSFDHPEVDVVGGNTYIEPKSLYDKAFALGWFFPLESSVQELKPANRFFANNVAFKQEIFNRFPFPLCDDMTRGSCVALANELKKHDVGLYMNTAAQLHHPPPNGIRHFMMRGLAQGRDNVMREILKGSEQQNIPLHIFHRLHWHLKSTFKQTIRHYRDVRLSTTFIPLALLQMMTFYSLCALGGFITYINPEKAKGYWRI